MSDAPVTCIICPNSCQLTAEENENGKIKVRGAKCRRGIDYMKTEIYDPARILAALVPLRGGVIRMCPVRTDKPVPKNLLVEMARAVASVPVTAPVHVGDVVVENIMGTGADLIVTRDIAAEES